MEKSVLAVGLMVQASTWQILLKTLIVEDDKSLFRMESEIPKAVFNRSSRFV